MYKKLSILVPVYNEKKTITECINNILKSDTLNLEKEIIISDNNSNDGTQEILKQIVHPNVKVIYRNKNDGKGATLEMLRKCKWRSSYISGCRFRVFTK